MELIDTLSKYVIKTASAYAVVNKVTQQICSNVNEIVLNKYKGSILVEDELKYEMLGCNCDFYWFPVEFTLPSTITIHIDFICCSPLPKEKREKVEEVKKLYAENKRLAMNAVPNYKVVSIWKTKYYKIDLIEACKGNINLKI